ncbi:Protein giant [Gryllus bimaculatus]|nr:Protein giant [Gryllus bimaculatus]
MHVAPMPLQQQQQQQKDSAYYERRRRNNEAAKRSRDARRAKEDEVAIRAAFLEQGCLLALIQCLNSAGSHYVYANKT